MGAPPPLVPTFDAYLTRRLRKLGLRGERVVARVRDGALELRGDAGGAVRVPWADVARLRVGYADGKKGPLYEIALRLGDGRELTVMPHRESWRAYADAVRVVVADLSAAGGLGRVERGLSKGVALMLPIALTPLAFAAIAVSVFALENEPWWGRLVPPTIPILLVGLTLWVGLTRLWPRPVAHASEIESQLPR